MKRVFIVHRWGGNPREPWFVWIKKELEKRNFKVIIPKMPNTNHPKINSWVNHLKKVVKNPNKDTYFIGHSIGCQAILRYLQTLNKKIGGCVFVAGWFNLSEYSYKEEPENEQESRKIAKPWVSSKIDFNKIKRNSKKIVAIFSDNDPYVPLDNIKIFKNKLKAKIIIEHNKGHFDPDSNIKKVPSALKAVLKISK